jgi:hypothetical protein
MASTYSNLKIQLMATGENSGTWGNVTNANLGDAIEQALVETATVTFASANVTLTLSDSNSKQNARALRLNLTGTTAGARDLIVPAIQKPYLVNNGTADTVTVKVSGQTGIAVPAGASMLLYNNGTDVIVAFNRVVGNVVGNVTGNVTGTASNATVLQTARTIAISGNVTGTATSFDGSGNISIPVTAINVDAATAGTLAVARGGTGATTLNSEAVIIGNTTGAVKFVAPGTSGNVLTSNGTAWASQAISAGGDYVMQVYTSPATWTKPASVKAVKVTVVGGGGGGGAAHLSDPSSPSASYVGGGGGAAIEYLDAPAIPGPVSVTVGSGGAGGTLPSPPNGNAGSTGGTSSFGPFLSATGGGGGSGPGTPGERPGTGGTGSGGQLNFTGGAGPGIQRGADTPGGSSILSSGSPITRIPGPNVANGTTGNLYGGGGSGANGSGPAGGVGAAGAAGVVIVEEFY